MDTPPPPVRAAKPRRFHQVHRPLFRNELAAEHHTEGIVANSPPSAPFYPLRTKDRGLPGKPLVVHSVRSREELRFGNTEALVKAFIGGSDVQESIHVREQSLERQPLQRTLPPPRRSQIIAFAAQPYFCPCRSRFPHPLPIGGHLP